MPLHLLGKKSWNVYNPANIARVKADEAAAAAREAVEDQRMQELDAHRRAALLRGKTPPPLPDEIVNKEDNHGRQHREKDERGHDRKRRKLAGEDDTDRDIRLATSVARRRDEDDDEDIDSAKLLTLRKPASDAPLMDHAGNINLFPIDHKEVRKREKNAEAEEEKKRKRQALEDQYTMRLSNAAGRSGLDQQPWYKSGEMAGFEAKDVWGNEDPRRQEREQARISSSDPFAFMQKAQVQLKKSKDEKKRWAAERERELWELRAAQERDSRRERHGREKRKRGAENDGVDTAHLHRHREERGSSGGYRSRSVESKHRHKSSHRRHRGRSRSRSRDRGRDRGKGEDRAMHRHERSKNDARDECIFRDDRGRDKASSEGSRGKSQNR